MSHKNGWWFVIRCSLNAIHSRTRRLERSLIRSPQNPQSPKLPLYKEILQFLPKLRKLQKPANFFLLSFNTAKLRLPEVRSSSYIEFHRVIGPKLTLYAVKMLINFTLSQVHSFLCFTYETIACSLGNFCYLGRPQISSFFYGHAKIINFHQCI